MKQNPLKLTFLLLAITGISIFFYSFNYRANNKDKKRRELVNRTLDYAVYMTHYHPALLTDDFSEKAYDSYLEKLDYRKQFFIQDEIDQLEAYRHKLDDELRSGSFEFFDLSVDLLEKATERFADAYEEILEKPFDYDKKEEIQLDPEKLSFAKSTNQLEDRWRKSLKYEVIARILTLEEENKENAEKSDTVDIKDFQTIEKIAREKIQKRYKDYLHRLEKLTHNDFLNRYINSYLGVNDPHTSYFPPKEKKNFDINMAGKLEGIGAQLTQKDIYVEVIKIIPGSPAYKGGELEVKDKILKVAQYGEEPIDIVDMRLDDAIQFIRGKKGTRVTLTVKKANGSIQDITITRDVINLDYTYAKSAIIYDNLSNRKIGIINLPSFYVDFEDKDARNCFTDVEKEVEKLNNENVDALIFDLRSNGGGSLSHVVKIGGLFIDKGVIVQVKNKQDKIKKHADIVPGVKFDKPMVVLVNELSASASEILAAAMQDYKRAIILGARSSFGKGTVQTFYPLDRLTEKPDDMQSLGSLKVTIQKFYRVSGGSTQLKGVIPDVHAPDYFDYVEVGEKDLDNPMEWDKITPAMHNYWKNDYDRGVVINKSLKRIAKDTNFIKITKVGKIVKQKKDSTLVKLDIASFRAWDERIKEDGKLLDDLRKDTLGLNIKIPKVYLAEIKNDTSKVKVAEDWILSLKKDPLINEAFNLSEDMILLGKKR